MKTHLLFSLTFQLNSVVWAEKLWGGNPSTLSLSLLVFGIKTALSAGECPWEQEAPGVFRALCCSRSHDSR